MRQLVGQDGDLPGGSPDDEADVGLGGVHALQRMHTEEQPRQRGRLVGGHQPRARSEQEHELHHERHQAQAPERDRLNAPGRVEHQIDSMRVLRCGHRPGQLLLELRADDRKVAFVLGRIGVPAQRRRFVEARLHVLAQLVAVVGQAQQTEVGHYARVQPRMTDGQAV